VHGTDPSNDAAQPIDSRAYRTFPNALTFSRKTYAVYLLSHTVRRSEITEPNTAGV